MDGIARDFYERDIAELRTISTATWMNSSDEIALALISKQKHIKRSEYLLSKGFEEIGKAFCG